MAARMGSLGLCLALGLLHAPAHAADWVGGDWGGADLVVADGDTLTGAFVDVGAFAVPAGATVRVLGPATLRIEASTITVDGTLDASEAGHAGGRGEALFYISPESGLGPGGGGRGPSSYGGSGTYITNFGGAGAGHAGAGGTPPPPYAGAGALPGPAYGSADARTPIQAGSGGGGGACDHSGYYYPDCVTTTGAPGGDGGGAVLLIAPVVTVDGSILANGGDGGDTPDYGSGGGSGGTIAIVAGDLGGTGTVAAQGGDGGQKCSWYCALRAGGGSGGRVKLWASSVSSMPAVLVQRGLGHGAAHGSTWAWIGTPTLGPPVPGTAGGLNSATVTDAAPGLDVYVAADTAAGAAPIPGCSGFSASVGPGSLVLGPVTADAAGSAVFDAMVPAGQAGQSWQLQAIQPAACALSSALPWTF